MRDLFLKFCLDRPVVILFITLAIVASAGTGLPKLGFTGDYKVYFSPDNPQLVTYEAMQNTFSKNDGVSLLIVPQRGDVLNAELLRSIQQLTDNAWQIPFSTRVDSISNFQHTRAEGDELIVQDLVPDDSLLSDSTVSKIRSIATTDPQLVDKFISRSGDATLINVTINMPGIDTLNEEPQVTKKVRQLKEQFELKHPDTKVYLSGLVMMSAASVEAAMTDNATLLPLMLGTVILTIGLMLKTVSGTLSVLIIIICSVVTTMGLAGWAGVSLTGGSASAPVMILTLVVADCVHVMTTFIHQMRRGEAREKAMLLSLRANFQPILLTSVTTAIGFLSMNFSDSPPFNDLGNMVALGVMTAFVFSITSFPALLTILPLKIKPQKTSSNDLMHHIAEFVIDRQRVLLPAMSLAIVCLGMFATLNTLNDSPIEYFSDATEFRQASLAQEQLISGMTTIEIAISTDIDNGINDTDFIDELDQFTRWLRQQPEVDHVHSLSDTFKRLNQNMHGDHPKSYRLPETREQAAQYLLLYEMSLPYGLDLTNQVNAQKNATRLIATLQNIDSTGLLMLENRIIEWFDQDHVRYEASVSGPNLMFAHIAQRNIVSMIFGTLVALVLISILLGIALKSVRYCILSLIPNLAPAMVGLGLWGLWDGEISLGLSLVVGITLGIVVDNTVHLLSKYLTARRRAGTSAEQAVRFAFSNVGRALYITTIVLFLGFMCLAQSQFKLNADMGLLTAAIIVIALVIDFLLLPPLLIKLDHFLHPQNSAMNDAPQSGWTETIDA